MDRVSGKPRARPPLERRVDSTGAAAQALGPAGPERLGLSHPHPIGMEHDSDHQPSGKAHRDTGTSSRQGGSHERRQRWARGASVSGAGSFDRCRWCPLPGRDEGGSVDGMNVRPGGEHQVRLRCRSSRARVGDGITRLATGSGQLGSAVMITPPDAAAAAPAGRAGSGCPRRTPRGPSPGSRCGRRRR